MTVRKPVIHGRDHGHGGPDPIQVAWEDVGDGGGGGGVDITGLEWVRHAIFTASSLVNPGFGNVFSWDATAFAAYDPDNEVAARDGSLAHVINLLSAGVFLLEAQVYFQGSSTGGHPIYVGWQGGAGMGGPGAAVIPYMVDPSDSSSGIAAGSTSVVFRTTAPSTAMLQVVSPLAGAKLATLVVQKLSA